MFFLNWPASLWFLRGGGPVGSSVNVCVSAVYKISCSVGEVNSVDVELSTFSYGLSADLAFLADEDGNEASVQANINLDDNELSSLTLRASITPVFVIEQAGQVNVCASTNYQISASITASLGYDVVPSAAYRISASLGVSLLIADNICVSVNYGISASIGVALQVQPSDELKNLTFNYGVSTSLNPVVQIIQSGGLVWSKKLQRYVAVRIGQ